MTAHHARAERAALCDTLDEVGPDAPTLCDPWRTRDLAAHLVARESRPDLAMAMFVKPLHGWLERGQGSIAAGDWAQLVDRVRSGPPRLSPFAVPAVHEAANRVEFLVHHEDVRRAQPGWAPRELPADYVRALWSSLTRAAELLYRRAPVPVVLVADGFGEAIAKSPEAALRAARSADRAPAGTVVVHGPVVELLLHSYGRREHARVRVSGQQAAVDALAATRLSVP